MSIIRLQAQALLDSPRGEMLVSRALVTTIRVWEELPREHCPLSDLFDMQLLAEQLFPHQLKLEEEREED